MLIRLFESRSAVLHASIELISLDEVVEPNYWNPGGVSWSPSAALQERCARRSEDLAILLSVAASAYSEHAPDTVKSFWQLWNERR